MRRDSRFAVPRDASLAGAHPAPDELALYVDALASGMKAPLPAPLVEHVENCPHCQGQILDVHFYLRDPLRSCDPPRTAERPSLSPRPAWLFPALRVAAAGFAFILLAVVYYHLPRRSEPLPAAAKRAEPAPSLPAAAPAAPPKMKPAPAGQPGGTARREEASANKAVAGNAAAPDPFAANPNLESMVGSRSRGLAIEVYTPPNQARLTGEITFSWKEFKRESLSLAIVDNRNDEVFRTAVSGGAFLYRGMLRPGCYYWKLESPSELYYVGKFYVPAGPISPGG